MRTIKRLTGLLVTTALAVTALGACGRSDVTMPLTGEEHIRIGIRTALPGVGLMLDDGTPTGFDVDVAAYVAWKLGYSPYEIEWVPVYGGTREDALQEGLVDMVVAAFSITDQRREVVDFAGPYFYDGQDLLVRADDVTIAGPQSLDGKTICTVGDTVSETRIRQIVGDRATVVTRETYAECMPMLVSGEIDAVTTAGLMLAGLASQDEYFGLTRLVNNRFSQEAYGIGLPKGSKLACQEINAALGKMMADGAWSTFINRHTAGADYQIDETMNPPRLEECR